MSSLVDADIDLGLGPLQLAYEQARRQRARRALVRLAATLGSGVAMIFALRALIDAGVGEEGWDLFIIIVGVFVMTFVVTAAMVQILCQVDDLDVDEDALATWLRYIGPRLRTPVEQEVMREWLRHQPRCCTYSDLRALIVRLSSARKVNAVLEEALKEAPQRAAAAGIDVNR